MNPESIQLGRKCNWVKNNIWTDAIYYIWKSKDFISLVHEELNVIKRMMVNVMYLECSVVQAPILITLKSVVFQKQKVDRRGICPSNQPVCFLVLLEPEAIPAEPSLFILETLICQYNQGNAFSNFPMKYILDIIVDACLFLLVIYFRKLEFRGIITR